MRIRAAQFATIAPVMKREGKIGWIPWIAAFGASMAALSLIPVGGPAIAAFIDTQRFKSESRAQKTALAEWYRNQIGAQLGIAPEKVTYKDFELAAQTNPTFASMLDKVSRDEKRQVRGSVVGAAVLTPFSIIPGVAGIGKMGEMAIHATTTTAASMMGKSRLMVDDVATNINQKRMQGQALTASDTFLISLAHDKQLQEQIAKDNGQPFHKLAEAQQEAVMRSMPQYLAAAEKKAYAVNQGLISEQDLIVQSGEEVKADGGFSDRFKPKVSAGSRVEALQMERAMASSTERSA